MDERNGLFREMQKNDGCFKTNEKNNKNERFKIVNKFEKTIDFTERNNFPKDLKKTFFYCSIDFFEQICEKLSFLMNEQFY